ncbi:MAG: type II secretion system F family protein, partial [Pseudoclavibacter sp.]
VCLIGVPLAALLLPVFFGTSGTRERLDRLDALESWTRSLAGLTVAGAGLEQTITVSLSSAGSAIRPHVATLVARINARWRTATALRSFADDMADPTCDLIVMHLLLAERMRGPGLARALEDLADSIAEEVRARRSIETDRAKPQQNVRIITLTTLLLLVAMPFVGSFMAPYSTPNGQLLLACWIAVYAAILVWMRRIARPPKA